MVWCIQAVEEAQAVHVILNMTDNDFKLLIKRFYELQAERVETYRLFDEGHQAYMKSGPHYDFIQYRMLVHEITQAFNGISKEIIQMKDRFREVYDRSDLSEHLDKIQELEKEKLSLTARLQLAKQNVQDHPSEEAYKEEVQQLKHNWQFLFTVYNWELEVWVPNHVTSVKVNHSDYMFWKPTPDRCHQDLLKGIQGIGSMGLNITKEPIRIIKTVEAISEVLQDFKYDCEEIQ